MCILRLVASETRISSKPLIFKGKHVLKILCMGHDFCHMFSCVGDVLNNIFKQQNI